MKKVDIITFADLNHKNGANAVIKVLKQLGDKKNIEINNVISSDEPNINLYNNKKNIFLKIFKKIEKIGSKYSTLTLLIIYMKYIYRAKKIIKKYIKLNSNSEILMFHDLFSAYSYLKIKPKCEKKKILVLHTNGDNLKMINIYFPNLKKYGQNYLKYIEKFTLNRVEKIVFVSRSSLELFLEKNIEHKEKSIYIYNGIEDTNKNYKKRNYSNNSVLKLICVGTMNGRKGQELLIEAVKRKKEYFYKKIKFVLVGAGPKYKENLEVILKNKLEEFFDILGEKDNIKELLEKSDLFILPSYDEGLPIAIIEAMCQALPIIATKIGGIPEMITSKEGFLIKPTIDDVQEVLEKIIENKYALSTFSENSRKRYLELFSKDVMIERYRKVIKEL